MAYENIIVETRGRVGLIRLNRPQALNALNRALMGELGQAIAAFEADTNIGCMVITGSDKAFAAGADIKEMADKDFADAFFGDFCADWHQAAAARKPVVAAVAGFALGGGCELAMQCDLIIAADNAKFGQPEIKLGIIPGIGGTQRLTHAVGKAKAMDLILTGRMMDAAEAERVGPGRARRAGGKPARRGHESRRDHRRRCRCRRCWRRRKRSIAPSRRRRPKASASSGASFIRCSPPSTRAKACTPSSKSGRRSLKINDGNYFRTQITRTTDWSIALRPLAGAMFCACRKARKVSAGISVA